MYMYVGINIYFVSHSSVYMCFAATQLARQLHQDMYTFVCFVCLFVGMKPEKLYSTSCVVCCFVFLNRYWGIIMYGPGASS